MSKARRIDVELHPHWVKSWLVGAAVLASATGCALAQSTGQVAPDCTAQVRFDGRVYSSYGYTDKPAERFAQADEAECDDVGTDPAGSVFPDDPTAVGVWSFDGYSTREVLGVRFDEQSFAVFVEDSVPRADADRIFQELRS